ncbi:aryl-sulfate sulfotransferase [Sutterella wadsworthensis]|uniref:aryl-sulfate sulfotransferase n=3 Tax=Sutterella wadsworthensis TaxID=40545 RepID=UPI00242C0383|nr:aryl-sulfate sulfotransferase [Sutterella wadsworthensis]
MKFKSTVIAASVLAGIMSLSAGAYAMGGASGAHVNYPTTGKIGAVMMNPYGIAPLTAVIRNGGYSLSDISVRIVPKDGGQEITYTVSDAKARTHGGIPIFGLYAGYRNTVEVSYTKTTEGKSERVEKEVYRIYAGPANIATAGYAGVTSVFPVAEVKKVDPAFSDRLYLINNMIAATPNTTRAVWNNPMGGALEWNRYPQNAIYDTKGEIRWYMEPSKIYDPNNIYMAGIMMGFRQNNDGAFTWGYGQRYVKYDLMGREIFNRQLPDGYADFSHAMDPMQNGNYLVRVASADHARPDGKHVRTVRDVIIEVDQNGTVVDEWALWDILDPYRNNVLKALDQGAVCLNIDATKAGQTITAEQLAELDKTDNFGDIVGAGAGRNWAHINSVDYDPTDDSIIISSRHQSALIKIGRDKQVKWIMGSPEGWGPKFADRVLKPVDKDGKPIKCEGSKCEGDFDWTWTQHTGWRVDSKSDKDVFYLSVFDNGDARGMEQPALPEMKYSRAVVYKIDQKKMTVEQIWEVGKDLGHEYYSPVTGLCGYEADKNSVTVFYSTAGLSFQKKKGTAAAATSPHPYLYEYRWGETQPAVALKFTDVFGYQAFPISVKKAFTDN